MPVTNSGAPVSKRSCANCKSVQSQPFESNLSNWKKKTASFFPACKIPFEMSKQLNQPRYTPPPSPQQKVLWKQRLPFPDKHQEQTDTAGYREQMVKTKNATHSPPPPHPFLTKSFKLWKGMVGRRESYQWETSRKGTLCSALSFCCLREKPCRVSPACHADKTLPQMQLWGETPR